MARDAKISGVQLVLMMVGFYYGSSAILNPASSLGQDGWFAYTLGWLGAIPLLGIYLGLSFLNPRMTLIEMLQDNFGKVLGSLVGVLYIWYFFHLAALILRNFGEYMVSANYPTTPLVVIHVGLALVAAYAVKNGIEVLGRLSEFFIPLLILLVIWIIGLSISSYQFTNLLPFLEHGWQSMLQGGFRILTFPFGEAIVFLMVFNSLHQEVSLVKYVSVAYLISGVLLISATFRDIMVLGPDIFQRVVFPAEITTRLVPGYDIDPIVAVNLVVGGGIKYYVCLYAALFAFAQLFKLDDYKPLVFPATALIVGLSIWLYDDLLAMLDWAENVYPYYAMPFQLGIPLVLLGVSLIRRKMLGIEPKIPGEVGLAEGE